MFRFPFIGIRYTLIEIPYYFWLRLFCGHDLRLLKYRLSHTFSVGFFWVKKTEHVFFTGDKTFLLLYNTFQYFYNLLKVSILYLIYKDC